MVVETKYFGTVQIEEDKVIHFEKGIPGFDEYKDYVLLYDTEGEKQSVFSWLQCATEKSLAFPVINPYLVVKDYNPVVEDELLKPLGEVKDEDIVILLLATVPSDIKKTTVNMKAPLIINSANGKGMQIVVENKEYEIKHYIMGQEEK